MLDDVGEFGDLDGSVVEEGFSFRYCRFVARVRLPSRNKVIVEKSIRCASLSNFPIVTVMPRPICAAFRANSDLALRSPFGVAEPFVSRFCASESKEARCAPPFVEDWRFCACVRMERNSVVRSCIVVFVMVVGCK